MKIQRVSGIDCRSIFRIKLLLALFVLNKGRNVLNLDNTLFVVPANVGIKRFDDLCNCRQTPVPRPGLNRYFSQKNSSLALQRDTIN